MLVRNTQTNIVEELVAFDETRNVYLEQTIIEVASTREAL